MFTIITSRFISILLLLLILQACAPDKPDNTQWNIADNQLLTDWAQDVSPANALPEYPRPQLVREEWINLNGLWEYSITDTAEGIPEDWKGHILVPYAIESALSGVGQKVGTANRLWYRRTFNLPGAVKDLKIWLHFGAVDWETRIWINGRETGQHKGGYDSFSFNITDALSDSARQEIVVSVWDPVDEGTQPRGKQVSEPNSIWYTSVTGIWQTVWLEPVKDLFIKDLKIIPDIDQEQLILKTGLSGPGAGHKIVAEILAGGKPVSRAESREGFLVLPVPEPRLWTPDDPFLYDIKLSLFDKDGTVSDKVSSYAGMRKISLGKDEDGLTRIMLNNEFLFQIGPLDQGWWPDGLYTAPTDEALRYDIEETKRLGFNMARKHVKIEPERWYYWCDKLGLLVWQDMPSGDKYIGYNDPDIKRSGESDRQFRYELRQLVENFFNHPSIVMWVPFNEGWGQYATGDIVDFIKDIDHTRLVNPSSGWADRKVGDIQDIHAYPGPAMPDPEEDRAIVLGEFGGLGIPLEGHTWQDKDNWGYRSFENVEELQDAYVKLIRNLMPMISKGLSAAVYTQTSDVEIEVNGLMTYDRKVTKFDPARLSRINSGFVPPLIICEAGIFLDSIEVSISNSLQGGEVRYTTDGSEPDVRSLLYTQPFKLENSSTVSARTYWPDGTSSETASLPVRKVSLQKAIEVASPESGLRYYYYENEEDMSELPDLQSLDPDSEGIAKQCNLKFIEKESGYILLFDGYIKIPVNGIYTFYPSSDDGSKLYIDNELVVDNDFLHGMVEKEGRMALKAGYHAFRLEFFQNQGGQGLEVRYAGPGIEKQIIPGTILFHK